MINSKQELLTAIQANRDNILSFGVERLGLFGSFVRGEMNKDSDVDFLVEFKEGQKNYDNLFDLHEKLQAIANRKIDLVTKESLSKHFGPYILKELEYVI